MPSLTSGFNLAWLSATDRKGQRLWVRRFMDKIFFLLLNISLLIMSFTFIFLIEMSYFLCELLSVFSFFSSSHSKTCYHFVWLQKLFFGPTKCYPFENMYSVRIWNSLNGIPFLTSCLSNARSIWTKMSNEQQSWLSLFFSLQDFLPPQPFCFSSVSLRRNSAWLVPPPFLIHTSVYTYFPSISHLIWSGIPYHVSLKAPITPSHISFQPVWAISY